MSLWLAAPAAAAATAASPPDWAEAELGALRLERDTPHQPYSPKFSSYNPTPGTGRTGVTDVPPNPYPFYNDREKYTPLIQPDGGQLSDWKAMYAPTKEEAEADRAAAYARGIPHGYKPVSGAEARAEGIDEPRLRLWVVSRLHTLDEYGADVDPKTGQHSGGPFQIDVPPDMRVEELRNVIRDVGGIVPALQRLSYAGKRLEDAQRTLSQCGYGITYWHGKFPQWPLVVRQA